MEGTAGRSHIESEHQKSGRVGIVKNEARDRHLSTKLFEREVFGMNKTAFWLIMFLLFLPVSGLYAEVEIMEDVAYPSPVSEDKVYSTNLFIDDEGEVFFLVNDYFIADNNSVSMARRGRFLNGFLENGRFYTAFEQFGNINIYDVKEGFKLAKRIKIIDVPNIFWAGATFGRIIVAPGESDSYLLAGGCGKFPSNPFDFLFHFTSGGHGIIYKKPILGQIRGDEMVRYLKFRYRGKVDESFVIAETVRGEKSINFLGFRRQESPSMGLRYPRQPFILYYVDYNLDKRKATRNHVLFEAISPGRGKDVYTTVQYGPLSMDSVGDDVFVVFSWYGVERRDKSKFDVKNCTSDIYYWQCAEGRFSEVEKIAEGFSPIVKADLKGNVHVFWISGDGVFFYKVKKEDGWSQAEEIIWEENLSSKYVYSRDMSVEFDKDNNLHMIYLLKRELIYVKAALN